MSLLYDRILAGEVELTPPHHITGSPEAIISWREMMDQIKVALPRAQVFKIDNVSTYYYEERCQTWNMYEDFPNLAPPFNIFWMEHRPPRWIKETVTGQEMLENPAYVMRDGRGEMGTTGVFCVGRPIENREWGFELQTILFSESLKNPGHCISGLSIALWKLDSEGRPTFYAPGWYAGATPGKPAADVYTEFSGVEMQHTAVAESSLANDRYWERINVGILMQIPAFLALCFLHCKNVYVKTEQPPAPLSKKHQKNTGLRLTTFKTLEIEPMKKVLKHEGQSEHTGIQKALHICRGHFKDYREHGLGKHHVKGLWWWDTHVRGTIEQGVVNKDYSIKTPTETISD